MNEATPAPNGIEAVAEGRTMGRDGYDRPWSTAVASTHALRAIDDAQPASRGRTRKGPVRELTARFVDCGVGIVPDLGEVTVVSLCGLLDEMNDASVRRSLSEVSPLFDDRRYSRQVLLGGDLNTWSGWNARSDGAHLARDRGSSRQSTRP